MSAIIPFTQAGNVPAFLAAEDSNNDLTSHAGQSFPTLSIKGKVFTIVSGDTRQVLPNPKDPSAPATYIGAILVKVSPHKAKSYYAQGFRDGAEGDEAKPTCFSNDGIAPDASAREPQCAKCAACPHNVFGTARTQDGVGGKGKACSDFVRVVLCTPDDLDTLYLLRVPPASIRNLGSYGDLLNKRKVPYQGVITKISFDMKEATPRLLFEPVGFVADQAMYNKVKEASVSEAAHRMLYGTSETHAAAPAPQVAVVEPPKPVKKAPAPVTGRSPAEMQENATDQVMAEFNAQQKAPANPAPSAQDAAVAELVGEVMQTSVPKAAPAAKPAAKPTVVESDNALEQALGDFGFDS